MYFKYLFYFNYLMNELLLADKSDYSFNVSKINIIGLANRNQNIKDNSTHNFNKVDPNNELKGNERIKFELLNYFE